MLKRKSVTVHGYEYIFCFIILSILSSYYYFLCLHDPKELIKVVFEAHCILGIILELYWANTEKQFLAASALPLPMPTCPGHSPTGTLPTFPHWHINTIKWVDIFNGWQTVQYIWIWKRKLNIYARYNTIPISEY